MRVSWIDLSVGWMNRVLSVAAALVTTPLLLAALGTERYAAMQIVQGVAPWLALLTLGVGPAAKNALTELRSRDAADTALRRAVALYVWCTVLVGCTALIATAGPIGRALIGRLAPADVEPPVVWALGGMLLLVTALGQIGGEILFADDRATLGYLINICAVFLRVGAISGLYVAPLDGPWVLPLFALANFGPGALLGAAALWKARVIGPTWNAAVLRECAALLRRAAPFAGFAFVATCVLAVDTLIMSQTLQAAEIALYAIMMVAVQGVLNVYATTLSVLWPRWSRGFHSGESAAVISHVHRLARGGGLCAGIIGAGAIVAVPWLLQVWLGARAPAVTSTTTALFMSYLLVRVWTDTYAVALLAEDRPGLAARVALLQACVTGPLQLYCGLRFGVNGIIGALVIGYVATAAWILPFSFASRRAAVAADGCRAAAGVGL